MNRCICAPICSISCALIRPLRLSSVIKDTMNFIFSLLSRAAPIAAFTVTTTEQGLFDVFSELGDSSLQEGALHRVAAQLETKPIGVRCLVVATQACE